MKIKRIIALLLVLVALTSVFASCDAASEPVALVAAAEVALKMAPYTVNSTVEYTSTDEGMSAMIKSFSSPTIKVTVDGDKFRAQMDVKNGDVSNYVTITYVDGFLYTQWMENGKAVNNKEEYTAEDKAALVTKLGSGADINVDDFNNVSASHKKGVDTISCDGIKAESLGTLVTMLEEQFTSLDAKIEIKDATLTMNIEDGKYTSSTLTCEYYITTSIDCYVINMTYTTEYDYESGAVISSPVF